MASEFDSIIDRNVPDCRFVPGKHLRKRDYSLKVISYNQTMSSLKEYFLLDPDVIFLNHGSYGATPKPVFEAYQNWQLRLEHQPVLFLGRELPTLMREARTAL